VLKLISGLEATAQEVELRAEAAPEVRLSWFVDGVWLGSAGADETLWWTPSPGAHEIVALDEAGRADRRALRVDRGAEG
jgi:penicillin-binding protein 1C